MMFVSILPFNTLSTNLSISEMSLCLLYVCLTCNARCIVFPLPACLSDSFGQPSVVQHLPNPSPFLSEPSTVAGLFRGRKPVAGGCLVWLWPLFCVSLCCHSLSHTVWLCLTKQRSVATNRSQCFRYVRSFGIKSIILALLGPCF